MSCIYHHYLPHVQQTHLFSRLPVLTPVKAKKERESLSVSQVLGIQWNSQSFFFFFHHKRNTIFLRIQLMPNILTLLHFTKQSRSTVTKWVSLTHLLHICAWNCVVSEKYTKELLVLTPSTCYSEWVRLYSNLSKCHLWKKSAESFFVNTHSSIPFYIYFQFRQAIFAMF